MPDVLDQHDFEELLREHHRRPGLMYERLEHFFREEIPARERRRAAAPKPGEVRRIPATVRVLSPHETSSDIKILGDINDALAARAQAFRLAPIADDAHTVPVAPPAAPPAAVLRPMSEAPLDGEILAATSNRAGCKGWLIVHYANGGGEEQPRFEGWFYWTGYDFCEIALDQLLGWLPLPTIEDKHFSRAKGPAPKPKDEQKSKNGKAGAAVRAATTGKKARPAKRWARAAFLAAAMLTACGGADDMSIVGDDQVDADAGELGDGGADIDADPNAPDAAPPDAETGGLSNGAACDPLAAECAGGLTCRVTSLEPVEGTCRPSGTALENDTCDLDNGDGDCGAAMACIGTTDPRCYVICDRADPEPRCGVADPCVAVWGADVEIGACSP